MRGQFDFLNVFGKFLFIYILGQSYCSTYSWDILLSVFKQLDLFKQYFINIFPHTEVHVLTADYFHMEWQNGVIISPMCGKAFVLDLDSVLNDH